MMGWMSEQDISLSAAERCDAGDIPAIYAPIVRKTRNDANGRLVK